MLHKGENVVILYLEDWQKRMINDFLGVCCDTWEVPIEKAQKVMYGAPSTRGGMVLKYSAPTEPPMETKRMYLTGWQMRELKDEAGVTCNFVELTKELNVKYGINHNKH